jgi:hypothetical protein
VEFAAEAELHHHGLRFVVVAIIATVASERTSVAA